MDTQASRVAAARLEWESVIYRTQLKPITFYLYPLTYQMAVAEDEMRKRMSPEPVDEASRGGIETRGGNRPSDYMPEDDAVYSSWADAEGHDPDDRWDED